MKPRKTLFNFLKYWYINFTGTTPAIALFIAHVVFACSISTNDIQNFFLATGWFFIGYYLALQSYSVKRINQHIQNNQSELMKYRNSVGKELLEKQRDTSTEYRRTKRRLGHSFPESVREAFNKKCSEQIEEYSEYKKRVQSHLDQIWMFQVVLRIVTGKWKTFFKKEKQIETEKRYTMEEIIYQHRRLS